jgi:predicted dehydrogenase
MNLLFAVSIPARRLDADEGVMLMSLAANRRRFLQSTALGGIGFWVAGGIQAQESKSPNERIGMASIGVGGKGMSDSKSAFDHGDLVAVCDVDESQLDMAGRRFSKTEANVNIKIKKYADFRQMLDEMGKSIDAVTISTPDHTHAAAALMAMRMGKHCFCQDPLARTLYETRLMARVAKEKKLATQMGNQSAANIGLRKGAAMLRAGMLGTVTEIHAWTDRPTWPQGGERPKPSNPPPVLKWDLWLGPAPLRDYASDTYLPVKWRGWWDFGTGALGAMGCHTLNMPFMGLDLRNPVSVQAETSGHKKDSFPKWSIIHFEFPAVASRPAVKLVWYDGGKQPDRQLLEGNAPGPSGCLIVGSKGKLYSGTGFGGIEKLYGEAAQLYGVRGEKAKVEYVQTPGHFIEWVRAIKGGKPAVSNFPDYAAPLSETVLVGNLAVWAAAAGKGEKIEWDSANLKAKNIKGLEAIIKPVYRKGYTLDA